MTATLAPDEIERVAGGLKQPRRQLEELKRQGFHRARLGMDGQVILERPHYEAVCAGRVADEDGKADTPRPQLRSVQTRA